MRVSSGSAGKVFFLLVALLPGVFLLRGSLVAQVGFEEVEQLLNRAGEAGAELLSPKSFQAAQKEYRDAVKLRDEGKSLKDIEKKRDKAKQMAQSVINNIKLAEVTFAEVLPAREKTLKAGAVDFVPERWEEVSDEFRKAAVSLEEGEVKKAKNMAVELSEMFQAVELEAIKQDIAGSARAQAVEIEEDVLPWAAVTYQKGVGKIDEAEGLLDSDRYARDSAEALISEAEYELRHAQAITARAKAADEKEIEAVFLNFEDDLKRISDALGIEVGFDVDREEAVAAMEKAARDLVRKNRELSSELYSSKEAIQESQELKESLQMRLDEEKRKQDQLNSVQRLFKTSEAKVFRDDKNRVVLRLVGFSFPAGRKTIEPVYFDLLSRVQKALKVFPGANVVIEGHTDSRGDANSNKVLSQGRAEAIQQYLVANLGLDPELVTAVGYGEERPIANNESAEGRVQNRRVDILIIPAR